jgi:type II secretory pathway component GspD/PulD (secretin)
MRRLLLTLHLIATTLAWTSSSSAQSGGGPRLEKLPVPAAEAKSIATKLSLQYRDLPGVKIAPDVRNAQLLVMAPEATQKSIAKDVQALLASHEEDSASGSRAPLNVHLHAVTWREFENDLQRLCGQPLPVTTSRNGELAAFQLAVAPLQGTTVEVDRHSNDVTVVAPPPSLPGWQKLIAMLDKAPAGDEVTQLMRLENAEPAPIQRALRLLQELEDDHGGEVLAAPLGADSPFRNAIFQQEAAAGAAQQPPAAGQPAGDAEAGDAAAGDETGGSGVIGDTQIQFVPELGTIIIRGAKRDVERVMEVIKQIEEQSEITKPDVEVVELEHADANAVAALLQQLYEDVLSARQGEVSITSLDTPNSLLLIGRKEAIQAIRELIAKIDIAVPASSQLRVFRLQNASAVDAEQTILGFFTDRPGQGDDVRPGLGTRVRVLADYRTNSLIISAAPRDMVEVTRLINELDVQQIAAQNQIKVFPLSNAVAEDLAEVLQSAINGQPEGASDDITAPSTTLSIVALDSDNNAVLDSGILADALVTADSGANAIVVRAPAASMPLIGELIRQLDKPPGIDSLVKVFTVEYGDATQLTTSLQTLFGEDAGALGTSVGAANLPPSTGGSESSLVPLRFSTDVRTNSVVASGSAEDLEVVESILLRLDTQGFAERITDVIWLRHQAAADVATAVQSYVTQRTTTINQIQQFQQGLGPYDLVDRDLIVVAEPVSNSILLSVSPRLYEDVRHLIDKLDRRPPMVMIKVMIAEVLLDDTFEIGGEVGLQDSLLYDRGIAAGSFPGATPPSTDPTDNPGFNFNNAGLPNANSFGQGNVATRGVTSFGVGTTNSALGYGGFVLSAASDSVSLLLRTLQDASRLQVLSRPQMMTMDNTEGFINVGRIVARVTGVQNLGVGQSQVITEDIDVGLTLRVRPRVGADGLIVMDIDATRSERDDQNGTLVPTGNAITPFVTINDILQTTAQSTIAAYSGQTVIYGGLIQKTRLQFSRRVPYLSNIPLLGYLFKYEQESERRTETLVIMTPMLITGEEDLEYIKQVESSRMSWCLADVVEAYGDVGLSGGYGLWGPAVGNTIYPDIQPTVDAARHSSQSGAAPGSEPCAPGSEESVIVDPNDWDMNVSPTSPESIQGTLPEPGFPLEMELEQPGDSPEFDTLPAPVQPRELPTPPAPAQARTRGHRTTTARLSVFALPEDAANGAATQSNWSDLASQPETPATQSTQLRPKPARLGISPDKVSER